MRHMSSIVTDRLPSRCPACAKLDPTVQAYQSISTPRTVRLGCSCGWSEKYQLSEKGGTGPSLGDPKADGSQLIGPG